MKDFPLKSLLKKFKESGFTLIEMAVVLVVVGVIVSIMTTALPLLLQSAKQRQAKTAVEKTDFSLEGYLISKGRFPCPDTDAVPDGLENRVDNGTATYYVDDSCTAYVGTLPYRTLGLSSGKDPWQNVVRYGVYEDLIRSTGGTESTSFCNVIKRTIPTPANTAKIYTTVGTTDTNKAYVIVSGGSSDADNTGGFFDGLNGDATPLQFEDAGKITLATYDDIVKAASFNYLAGKECVGTETGGVPGGDGENTYPNGCLNTIDDDGDGAIDCADSDCATDYSCTSSTQVVITAATLPSGYAKAAYTATISATGGTPPYTWELLNKGGFADFVINPYTGVITGTLNQCPGTYAIQVKATDSATPTPSTDTESFSITVNKAITINGSSSIIWGDPDQQIPYNLTGTYFGTPIGWTLATTPAVTGFTTTSTGNDSCIIKKTGTSTAGPYTFNLTATDPTCSVNNKVTKPIAVTITAQGAATPTIASTAIARWNLDESAWNGTTNEVKDSSANLLHGTASGNATTTTGKVCRAGQFDGTGDIVTVPDSAPLRLGGKFTIALWFKTSGDISNGLYKLVGIGPSDQNSCSYSVNYWGSGGTDEVGFRIGDTSFRSPWSGYVINDGNWHFIVTTFDNTLGTQNMKIYFDNSATAVATGNRTTAPVYTGNPLEIGSSPGFAFNIDEITIYNKVLNSTEMSSLWNGGAGPVRTCP